MRNSNPILSILLSLLFIPPNASPTPHQAPLGPSPPPAAAIPFTFRNATLEDVDDITTVWYDAFRPAPMWDYIYQFTDDVDPLYRWTCQRDAHLRVLQDESRGIKATVITVQVPVQVPVPVPDPHSTKPPREDAAAAGTRERVVSVAMWDLNETRGRHHDQARSSSSSSQVFLPMGLHDSGGGGGGGASSPSPFDCSARLDVNITRALHFSERMSAAQDKYLRGPLGPQLYLGLLATHPDWDGNGFAAVHLRWGKAQLGRLGGEVGGGGGGSLPLTLIASPAGYPLYVSEGFEGLKNVTVGRLDGKGFLWDEIMKFEEGDGGEDALGQSDG